MDKNNNDVSKVQNPCKVCQEKTIRKYKNFLEMCRNSAGYQIPGANAKINESLSMGRGEEHPREHQIRPP